MQCLDAQLHEQIVHGLLFELSWLFRLPSSFLSAWLLCNVLMLNSMSKSCYFALQGELPV